MEYKGQYFTDSREVLDGNRYDGCTFQRCTIVYRGGELPHITRCSFGDCAWQLEDAADRTLAYLHSLYHGTGDAGRALIEQTFEMIRRPPQAAP
jgi:hypothetical protein